MIKNYEILEGCVIFQKNQAKYVYGLTYSFLLSSKASKYKFDYLVIPSSPFKALCFRYAAIDQILALRLSFQEGIHMKDQYYPLIKQLSGSLKQVVLPNKTFIKQLLPSLKLKPASEASFQYYPDHAINEDQLIISLSEANQTSSLFMNQNKLMPVWINNPSTELKIVVPECGMTTYLCLRTDLIIVNPTHHFVADLLHRFSPHPHSDRLYEMVHTVVVSKKWSIPSVLSLMVIQDCEEKKIKVILTSQELEKLLIEGAEKYLGFPEELVRQKLFIRTIGFDLVTIAQNSQNFDSIRIPILVCETQTKASSAGGAGSLYILYTEQKPDEEPRFQIHFGHSVGLKTNRKIVFYGGVGVKSQLNHFPQDLKNANFEYMICYGMKEVVSKELKALPLGLRKKIILNRQDHKYNHKYFITFTNTSSLAEPGPVNHCTIMDTQALQYSSTKKNDGKLLSPGTTFQYLEDGQKKSGIGNIFRLEKGILCYEQNGEKVFCLAKKKELRASEVFSIKSTVLSIISSSNNKTQNWKTPGEEENILNLVDNNSFVKSLSKKEMGILNKICRKRTFEVGNKIEENEECAYFILKGVLKWENKDSLANTGSFIGNLKKVLDVKGHQRLGDMQVVKDTWTVELNIPAFYRNFLCRFPFRLHQIYEKGDIFQ